MSASRRKPPGKATAFQEVQEEGEPSTFQETPPVQRPDLIQDSQPIDSMPSQTLEPRAQLNQGLSNIIGASVQLTDDQFQSLLARLRDSDLRASVPSVQEPLHSRLGDPDDYPSESSHHSYQGRRNPSQRRSPKHDDPEKLDDGVSPTYASWCILLEGKLEANADWWPTEQGRINYVFSRTTGKAQSHLEPRMSRTSATRWRSVEEILDHLDIVLRNHFEKEESQDQYACLTQGNLEDFNDFHSEFARLAALGEISPSIWRADLYRKLNRTLLDRLMSTEHQYPTYSLLVRECQRINVRLLEYRRRFPKLEPNQRRRLEAVADKPEKLSTRPPGILLPPRRSYGPYRGPPAAADKRESITPGRRSSPIPAPDPSKAACFNCGEVGHFSSACLNPRATPRINEIEQDLEASGDAANDDEDSAESESEN